MWRLIAMVSSMMAVGATVSAAIDKRVKYESLRPHHMEKHIARDSFAKGVRVAADSIHEVVIAVQQKNLAELEEIVLARATPGHAQYQQWLSFEEVGTMVRNEEGYAKVLEWLEAYEVEVKWSSPYGEYIRAEGRVREWERMLSTEFYEFEDVSHKKLGSEEKGKIFYRALEYSIPVELKESIGAIFNTVQTPPEYKARYGSHILKQDASSIHPYKDTPYKTHLRVVGSGGNHVRLEQVGSDVTISSLNQLYKVGSNLGSARLNQSVFQTNDEHYNSDDLTAFQQQYGLTVQGAKAIGGDQSTTSCSGYSCGEGNLDVQYIMGMAQKTTTFFWYVSSASDPFVTWVQDASASQYPPQSNSISWGETETLMSSSTVLAFETEAMKLAGRGVTILVSSGDDGAPGTSSSNVCLCSGKRFSGKTSSGYNPSFPATSKWVTAVGATMGPETGKAEMVCSSSTNGVITSGGGFSTKVSRPSWQTQALNYYFNLVQSGTNSPVSGYNTAGRGYPDISYIGVNYQVLIDDEEYSVFGTSASSPLFAAFVTLVNSARYVEGKAAIGFINPTLYQVGYNYTLGKKTFGNATFTDVTSGNNKCCKTSAGGTCCSTGFTAVKGWDPTTGWGSMDFTHFSSLFEVATPYVPQDSSDNNDNGGVKLNAIQVAIIFFIIAVVLCILSCLYAFFCSKRCQSNPNQAARPARANYHGTEVVIINSYDGTVASAPAYTVDHVQQRI